MKPPKVEPAGRRVLVVEDHPDVAYATARLLENAGHVVETVGDGPAALELAPAFRPDVVLIDIGLPGIDGYEVARLLREQGLGRAILVALTGHGRGGDRRPEEEARFDHRLAKPAEVEDLLKLIAASPRVVAR